MTQRIEKLYTFVLAFQTINKFRYILNDRNYQNESKFRTVNSK